MAESIVNFVLGKLVDVIVQEALLLYGVDEQVETMRRELLRIQAFLKDTDKKQITDERQKHWVKEVRDVAYSIEDAIDTFLSEIPPKPQKSTSKREKIKRMIKKTKKLPAVHKLLDEISQIQKTMKEIEASRLTYGINNLGEGSGATVLPVRPPVLPDIDPDVVGFKPDRDHVVKELLDETTKRRSVVSIWGTGGLGKTTLAQKVYNSDDVKRQFGLRIWVAVSQKYEIIDILREIARQLQLPTNPSNQPNEVVVFLTKLHESLKGKKYLIVLDDVWSDNLWTQIRAALPDENNGSRVLITTRISEVAKAADPACEPYELKFFTEDLSLELFLKKALPNQDPHKSAFHDISEITAQFVHKCGGLPLALVILGGLLSKKPRDYIAWSNVLRTISWNHDEGKKCSAILGTSFEDLPFALKSCFMYFAAFPEDYEIQAIDLHAMWVAEGFIPKEDNRTLEETAESFLEDLVKRSMVQVTSRYPIDGSIKSCRIHDLLRDLAVQKAKEENFLMVCSLPVDKESLSKARRVAVHLPDCSELEMSRNLRTLLCFDCEHLPNCSKQRLLKVVSIKGSEDNEIKLRMFEGSTQLRYLALSGTASDGCDEECFMKVLGAMRFLQTLDLSDISYRETDKEELPDFPWHIETLRHVYGGDRVRLPSSAKLPNLQTIPLVNVGGSWETELPYLPNLRILGLFYDSSSCGAVGAFLGTLEHLTHLGLGGPNPLDTFDMKSFPFYQRLQFLELRAESDGICSEVARHVNMFPPHLTYLSISNHQFQQDPMPVLEKLHYLKVLRLKDGKTERKMRCSARGFGQLEILILSDFPMLEEWEIEEGAMPLLRELNIFDCQQLRVPHGLQHLTNLQKLFWLGGNNKNEVRNLCKHVPSLIL